MTSDEQSIAEKVNDFMSDVLRYSSEDEDGEEEPTARPMPSYEPEPAPSPEEEEETTGPLDPTSELAHEYINTLFDCSSPREILEIVAEDPEIYLHLIENYKKTQSGDDVYLPNLINVVQTREAGLLHVKFKVGDNGKWYQVGFNDPKFTDADVYDEFTKRVHAALITDPVERDRQIALLNGVDIDEARKQKAQQRQQQKQQEKVRFTVSDQFKSKLDKFLKRDQQSLKDCQPDDYHVSPPPLSSAPRKEEREPVFSYNDDNDDAGDDACHEECSEHEHEDLMKFIETELKPGYEDEDEDEDDEGEQKCCSCCKSTCNDPIENALSGLHKTMQMYIQHVGAIVHASSS